MSEAIDELRKHFNSKAVPNSKALKEERDTVNALIDAVEEENAKLQEQADFEHFQLGDMKRAAGMMLDDYYVLLNEHNRLRKLCNDLLLCLPDGYACCYGCRYDECEDCRDGCRLTVRAKEMGIEVNH